MGLHVEVPSPDNEKRFIWPHPGDNELEPSPILFSGKHSEWSPAKLRLSLPPFMHFAVDFFLEFLSKLDFFVEREFFARFGKFTLKI